MDEDVRGKALFQNMGISWAILWQFHAVEAGLGFPGYS